MAVAEGFWAQVGSAAATVVGAPSLWASLVARLDLRQVRPRRAEGTLARRLTSAAGVYFVLKQPQSGSYVRLSDREFELWSLMDGTRSVRDLARAYFEQHGALAFNRIVSLVERLEAAGFLEGTPVPLYARLQRLASSDLPPRRLPARLGRREFSFGSLDPLVGHLVALGLGALYRPAGLVASGLLTLAGAAAFLTLLARGDPALLATGGSYGLGVLVLALATLLAVPLHELAHAVALKAGGGEVGEGGFLLHGGLPTFYVDTSDAWLGGRGLRARVSWAGPQFDLLIGALAALAALALDGTSAQAWLFKLALVCLAGALLSLSPLLDFDGYYLLSDWLDTPRLRERIGNALTLLRRGQRLAPDARRTLAAYLAAAGFWLILVIGLGYLLGGRLIVAALTSWHGSAGVQLGIVASLLLAVGAAVVQVIRSAARLAPLALARLAAGQADAAVVVLVAAAILGLGALAVGPVAARALDAVVLALAALLAAALAREDRGQRLRLFLLGVALSGATLAALEVALTLYALTGGSTGLALALQVVQLVALVGVGLGFLLHGLSVFAPRYRWALPIFGLGVALLGVGFIGWQLQPGRNWPHTVAVGGAGCLVGGLLLMRRPLVRATAAVRREAPRAYDDTTRLGRATAALLEAWLEALVFHRGRAAAARVEEQLADLAVRADWGLVFFAGRVSARPLELPRAARASHAALDALAALVVEQIGRPDAEAAVMRAFDALPWDEREVLSEHVLADQPWATPLLRRQRHDLDGRLALLRRMPLLAEAEPQELRALAAELRPASAPAGRRIVVQGEPGDRFYIVVHGVVEVRVAHSDGSVEHAAVLARGDYFGERALLNDAPRSATCTAATPVELLALDRAAFDRLLRRHFALRAKVDRALGRAQALAAVPAFAELGTAQARALARHLREERVTAGSAVVRQGEVGSRFYVIQSGSLHVLARGQDGQERLIAKLGPGEYFGEMALLDEVPRTATVVAAEACSLLVLEADDFRHLLLVEPLAHEALERAASRRRSDLGHKLQPST